MGLSHGSEGRQLKSTNSSAGLIQNCLSTTQTHQELVYHRQLHGPSGKKRNSASKLVPNVPQDELSAVLKGSLPEPDLLSRPVLFTSHNFLKLKETELYF